MEVHVIVERLRRERRARGWVRGDGIDARAEYEELARGVVGDVADPDAVDGEGEPALVVLDDREREIAGDRREALVSALREACGERVGESRRRHALVAERRMAVHGDDDLPRC